jgi:hypothetical protein
MCTILHEYSGKRMKTRRSMLILVAGPYLSGTDGDPERIAANLRALEAAALPLYERGHLAVVGEWLAWPVIRTAGGREPGDRVFQAFQYPLAHRLLVHCDAVLRLPGTSAGADLDVARARKLGLPVYTSLEEIPVCSALDISNGQENRHAAG